MKIIIGIKLSLSNKYIYLGMQQNDFSELCPLYNFTKENAQLIKLCLRFSTAILRKFQIPKVPIVMPEGYESFIKQKTRSQKNNHSKSFTVY